MVQLRDDLDELKDAGVTVVGISYDPEEVLKKFSDSQDIPFPLLSDVDSKTIHAFDIHHQKGLPHPMTILIDQSGVIRAKIFREGYVERHTTDELLAAAREIDGNSQ